MPQAPVSTINEHLGKGYRRAGDLEELFVQAVLPVLDRAAERAARLFRELAYEPSVQAAGGPTATWVAPDEEILVPTQCAAPASAVRVLKGREAQMSLDRRMTSEGVTAEEADAIRAYTGASFNISAVSRGGTAGLDAAKLGAARKQVELVEQGIGRTVTSDPVLVHRGVNYADKPEMFGPDLKMETLVGKTFHDPGFMSTSTSAAVGKEFAKYGVKAIMHITVPAGTPALWTRSIGVDKRATKEMELLLQRNTTLRITSVKRIGPQTYDVTAEVVPNAGAVSASLIASLSPVAPDPNDPGERFAAWPGDLRPGSAPLAPFTRQSLTAAAGGDGFCLPNELRKKTDPVNRAVVETMAKSTVESVGLNFDITNPHVTELMTRQATHITHVAETTKKQVRRVISTAYQEGLSIENTAKAISAAMKEANVERARLIARTELAGATNGGSLAAAQMIDDALGGGGAGGGLGMQKVWLTAEGAVNPRHEDYEGLNGQKTPLDGMFQVGGFSLQYPGDPNGPPEEICNCRCAVAYQDSNASQET